MRKWRGFWFLLGILALVGLVTPPAATAQEKSRLDEVVKRVRAVAERRRQRE